ncbi:MAG: sigma-70 family RNA polymerase sigma factor [Planctomycetes bacterium]|nr:sigma-70 family RNA polymerase sigma factor [Planctomycetota bacterium]
MNDAEETRLLLQRWHQGDRDAVDLLIRRDLPWIRDFVSARLGPLLRARGETQDYLQDAMLEVLTWCPRFLTADRQRFRALLARIIENRLRDAHDHHAAARRSPAVERALPNDSVLDLDTPRRSVTAPEAAAERHERDAWVRLAVELLDPEDRRVVLLRQWQELEFEAIGRELGISTDAARFRFQRAMPRLLQKLVELRHGHDGGAASPSVPG